MSGQPLDSPFLARLEARGFRNLEPLDLGVEPGRHLLLGGNGAGKSSLLEAIYVAATTRSFRAARLAECTRHGEEGFRLAARVEGARRADVEVTWGATEGLGRRVNGAAATLTEHLQVLPVVGWSSADLEILAGGPRHRRRFLDQGIVGVRPASIEHLSRYRRALDQKRELLSRGVGRGLSAWNELLAGEAAEIAALRAAYAERLAGLLADTAAASGLDLPPVTLSYRPSPDAALTGAERLLAALEEAAPRERERRAPLLGPHRDELEIRWGGHEVKRVASAGERKLIGLLLTAARGRVLAASARPPVYLLDDLDTELDRRRLEAVWELFSEAGQLFASSNRGAVWRGLPRAVEWRVEEGRAGVRDRSENTP
ncbi:MAG: DNA replication and repair protein RecF [Thermoanaerobaculia bacterium]|nr:DNA replication and repair protein RecF [Thermoanaerobaculia bacterium]